MARSFNVLNTDLVSWTGGPIMYNQTACSVGFWFKKDTMTSSAGYPFCFDQQSAFNKRLACMFGDGSIAGQGLGTLQYEWRTPTASSQVLQTTNRWDDGKWHRCLIVRRNVSPYTEIYIDGVSEGSSTTDCSTDATTPAGQYVGANFQGGGNGQFGSNGNGSMARFFILSGVTLTPHQADQILFYGLPNQKLDLLWELGIGSPEPDWSGNGISGSVTGTAVAANGPWVLGMNNMLRYAKPLVAAAAALRRNALLDGLTSSGSFFGNPL
jgi:hypothetical protein